MAAPASQPLIVVCGAAGALGRAVVAELASTGRRVVAVGRAGSDSTPAGGGAVASLATDLASAGEVEETWKEIDQLGTVDGLVNVAGAFSAGSVTTGDPAVYRSMMAANLDTAWWSCRAAGRRMAEGGSIVNVGSRSARQGGAGAAAYAVSKAAVGRLTEVLAAELAPGRVRVNAVLPGTIDSAANRRSMPPEAVRNAVPPEAIAKVVSFLLSEESWPVSGATIPVYGWS